LRLIDPVAARKLGDEETNNCTMNLKLPICVGMPDTPPVPVLRIRPGGNVPAAMFQLWGAPTHWQSEWRHRVRLLAQLAAGRA